MKRKNHDESDCCLPCAQWFPSDFGLTQHEVAVLARKLGVEQHLVLPETLAYVAQCKLNRGTMCTSESIVEIWDSIPNTLPQRDKENPDSRIIVIGANPRKPNCLTRATQELPHVSKLLASYVRHCAPNIFFNVLSLRLNADKGPHRDSHNGPEDSFLQVLTTCHSGGNLWLADPSGTSLMQVHGVPVRGTIHDCRKPFIFNSKTRLHATEPWTGTRRLTLVAWSTLTLDRVACEVLSSDLGFPIPPRLEAKPLAQLSIEASFKQASAAPNEPSQDPICLPVIDVPSSSSPDTPETTVHIDPTTDPRLLPSHNLEPSQSSSPFTPTLQDD